jgi:hypothetical protein
MRSLALPAAALLLSACSLGSGETRADERTASAAETAPPAEALEIPVEAKSMKRPPRDALQAELEWAAAWARWEDRFSSAYDRSESGPQGGAPARGGDSEDEGL